MPSGPPFPMPAAPLSAASVAGTGAAAPGTSDFDLHGLVGIRLIDPTEGDRAAVAAQLGPIAAPLRRDPDIVIRFVERLPLQGALQLVGVRDAAFAGDAFVVLQSKRRAPVKVRIDFDEIGAPCEIVCEHGAPAVPLLIAIINLTVLARGGLALHASAFRYRDTGALVTGWSKGGKTELLLAFIEHGAEYIGDEWIYIDADGQRMFGIPEPIRIWDWHLPQVPRYRRHLGANTRLKLAALRQAHGVASLVTHGSAARRFRALHHLRPITELIGRQRYAFLKPETAFGRELGPLSGSIDRVIFVGSRSSTAPSLAPVRPEWIADRMVFSLQEERSVLDAYYRRFRFAFPERRNSLLESAADLERSRLRRVLDGRPCFALYHPYPPSIPDLYRAAAPLFPA